MKRWKKILLVLLAALLLASGILCFRNRKNLAAVYTFVTTDSDTIGKNVERRREAHRRAIQEVAPSISVSQPNTQQNDALLSGETTPEEVKKELGISAQLETAGSEKTEEELVSNCVAELYACKVDLMAQLAEMKQAAVDQWVALPEEQRTETMKKEIGLAGLEDCYDLEVVIDAQVKEILERYRAALEKIGGSTAILDDLWDYYEDEKVDEKAYYMDKYLR